jgi:hypothetical protein
MKFTNNIDKTALRKALINWVTGADGADGATEFVTEQIPWTEAMGFDFYREEVHDKIDDAIGSRYREGGAWDVAKMMDFTDSNNATAEYRRQFTAFINEKVENIYNVYQNAIDKLNESQQYYWVVNCWDGNSEGNTETDNRLFTTHKECYEAMRKAVQEKCLWNIDYEDFDDCDNISIKITANRHSITVDSYSGIYTWEIHSCFK